MKKYLWLVTVSEEGGIILKYIYGNLSKRIIFKKFLIYVYVANFFLKSCRYTKVS